MDMIKTYKANTNISINVVLPGSKKNLHIAFVPMSDGSSVFSTDNEEIQKGVESHYKFGSLFRHVGTSSTKKQTHIAGENNTTSGSPDAESEFPAVPGAEDNEKNTVSKVTVTDLASAKDYLADKFGISRTSLRSAKAIMEQAAAHGIEFEGI